MHAPFRQPPDQSEDVHYHTWRGGSNGSHYFDSDYARRLIEQFNATGDAESLNRFLAHAEPLARSIIEYRNTIRHAPIDELLSRIRIKLWKSVGLFDPAKGTAFSFVAKVISTTSASMVAEAWNRSERFCELHEQIDSALLYDPVRSSEAVSDIQGRVRQVRTPCTDSYELKAQRWLVDSFLDSGFHLRRHQASDAMMQVYNIDYTRSRWLFDLTLVAVRRQLIDDRRLAPIRPASLAGTHSEGLIKFAAYLSAPEFTKLAALMKYVPPNVILSVDPTRACAIRRGEAEAIRQNVNLILNGSPTDRRLFA